MCDLGSLWGYGRGGIFGFLFEIWNFDRGFTLFNLFKMLYFTEYLT